MANNNPYITRCKNYDSCGNVTSKKYAREHEGKCRECVTGEPKKGLRCPDCGEYRLTVWEKAHGYHCSVCTHNVETSGGIYGF